MAFSEFMNHTCDIYHARRTDESPGYGLPSSPSFSYVENPDLPSLPCHFGVKGASITIMQKEPQAEYQAKIKLALPFGTDIRLNDKVVHLETGYEYTADIPQHVQKHHTFVYLQRRSGQVSL